MNRLILFWKQTKHRIKVLCPRGGTVELGIVGGSCKWEHSGTDRWLQALIRSYATCTGSSEYLRVGSCSGKISSNE